MEEPFAAGERVGWIHLGQERGFCRERAVRARGAEAAGDSGAGDVLRVQRCADQPAFAVAAAVVRAAPGRGSEDGDHGTDRGVEGVEVGAVWEFDCGNWREADWVSEWGDAVGRRV